MSHQHQPAQAFASHLINQTLSSIALLESLSLINPSDASLIRQKLPSPTGPFPSLNPPQSPSSSFAGLNISQTSPSWTVRHAREDSLHSPVQQSQPPAPQVQVPIQPVQHQPSAPAPAPSLPPRNRPAEVRAKALWDFNGTEGDDLQFRSGDIIVIDEEVNEQWYRGRVIPQGHNAPLPRSGLFPSNYIEKLPPAPYYASPPPPPQHQQQQVMVPYQGSAQSYYDQKQPMGQMQMMPPQQQVQGGVVVQEQQQQKGKFGKIGGQVSRGSSTWIVGVDS
ncbi:hypothetical protein I317_04308 [Kwoniella heveanensis CBS 569]|nr:hypothetical protein I317_04308 [Kwoniella heveanensis CBS 569]